MGEYQLQKRPQFRENEDENVLVEGFKTLAKGFASIFSRERTTIYEETYVPEPVLILNRAVSKKEVVSIENKMRTYYGQYFVYDVDAKTIFREIQQDLVDAVALYIKDYAYGSTYEEILKFYMDMAAKANNPITTGIDMLPTIDDLIGKDLIESNSFGIQRTTLAVVWSSLLLSIVKKYMTVTTAETNNVIKLGISMALSVGVLYAQFLHKSPESITNYIRLIYTGYNTVRNKYNMHFEKKIPDYLKMNDRHADFARMTQNEKITTGRILNMAYTFRIGDCCLSVLEGQSYISTDLCEKLISSIWPIPTQTEINKIFRMYSGEKLYRM